MTRAGSLCPFLVCITALSFTASCARAPETAATATLTPAASSRASLTPDAEGSPSLSGAIYRGEARGIGSGARVESAEAAEGYQVYVRRRGAPAWIGPVITDEFGRFAFRALPPGSYQARAYAGPIRIWEQIVAVPSVLPPIVARDVTVIYYPKAGDKGRVELVLESLGFPYEQRSPLNAEPTNAVVFGSMVSLDDLKPLAVALVRAGVQIRSIRRFAESSGAKAKLIEVEGDKARAHDPAFTVERIKETRVFAPL